MTMGIMLGLAAALLYGGSDFSGGGAARRLGPLRVSVIGCLVATVLGWALLGVVGGPVSAVGAAVVPIVAGVVLGERPGLLAVAGVLVALPAIVLVAASGSVRGRLGAGLF